MNNKNKRYTFHSHLQTNDSTKSGAVTGRRAQWRARLRRGNEKPGLAAGSDLRHGYYSGAQDRRRLLIIYPWDQNVCSDGNPGPGI